jgi:hypothetical protein
MAVLKTVNDGAAPPVSLTFIANLLIYDLCIWGPDKKTLTSIDKMVD